MFFLFFETILFKSINNKICNRQYSKSLKILSFITLAIIDNFNLIVFLGICGLSSLLCVGMREKTNIALTIN